MEKKEEKIQEADSIGRKAGRVMGRTIFLGILVGLFSFIRWLIGFETTVILILCMAQMENKRK